MKSLKKLGETLSKLEQQAISGGANSGCAKKIRCQNHCCPAGYCCGSDPYNCVLALPGGQNCR